jgi:hypothetical protein
MNDKPYTHFQVSETSFIRTFHQTVKAEELVWHRDKQERLVYVIHVDDGWSFQRDNQLPQKMITNETVLRIKAEEYHRLIKGEGVCVLYIEEK